MISLAPVKDKSTIVKMIKDNSVEYGENSGCLTAVGPDGLMGYSLYSLDSEKMVIYKIFPESDLPLADGILRSTLHIAAQRSVMDTYCTEDTEQLCEKLGFIKDRASLRLDIDRLFSDCCQGK